MFGNTREWYKSRAQLICYNMLKIGVIDSGLGGLSILKACLDMRVQGEYIYIYDNKFHPYGGRRKEELTAITFLNIEKLTSIGCDYIILACNTATSACIDDMRRTFYLPIIGTEPPIKRACEEGARVALLATPYTIHSERVRRIIAKYPRVKVYYPDCSGLATAVEFGYDSEAFLREKLGYALAKYSDCDGIALGCTHYSLVKNIIADVVPTAKIYEPCGGVARQLIAKIGGYITYGSLSSVRIIATGDSLTPKLRNYLENYIGNYPYKYC